MHLFIKFYSVLSEIYGNYFCFVFLYASFDLYCLGLNLLLSLELSEIDVSLRGYPDLELIVSGKRDRADSIGRYRVRFWFCWKPEQAWRHTANKWSEREIRMADYGYRRRLPTKLSRPDAGQIAPRRRLFKKVEKELAKGAVWIYGPPGVGKTALMASWVDQCSSRPFWMQIDEGDSDIATFFHYLTKAIRRFIPRVKLPAFTGEWLGAPRVFASNYFRKLFKCRGIPSVWILDDYHTLELASAVHSVLAEGLAERPPHIQFVVLSRSQPPAEFSRLIVHGNIRIVEPGILLLTPVEAKSLAAFFGCGAEQNELERLRKRTDGWVAGYELLLTAHRDSFENTTNDNLLFDYFFEEVFKRIDEAGRLLLIATSIVSDFTEAFAVSLSGIDDAGEMLHGFVQKSCFLYRLHGTRNAYRFHPLFREYLFNLALEVFGPQLRSFKIRAAELLWKEGREEVAVELACQVEEWDLVENYLLEMAPQLHRDGRLAIIQTILARFPEDKLNHNPTLQYWLGISLFQKNSPAALKVLEAAFHSFDNSHDIFGRALAWSAISEFLIFSLDELSGLQYWIGRLDEVLDDFELFPPEIQMNVAAAVIDVLAHFLPHHPALRDWTQKAFDLAILGSGEIEKRFHLVRALMFYFGFWGNNQPLAYRLLDEMDDFATMVDPFNRLLWLMAKSYMYFNAAEPGRCIEAVSEGLAVARESGFHHWDGVLLGIGAMGEYRLGNIDIAVSYFDRMRVHVSSWRQSGINGQRICEYFFHYVAAFRARENQDYAEARRQSEIALGMAKESGMPFILSATYILRALCRDGDHDRKELAEALCWGQRNRHAVVETCSYLALAYHCIKTENVTDAMGYLKTGFRQSRKTKIINYLLGPFMMATLCRFALEHGIETEQAAFIMHKLDISALDAESCSVSSKKELSIYMRAGRLSILRNDRMLAVHRKTPKKTIELLTHLVNAGPRGTSLESLADTLWEDSDGDRAVQALHTAIYRLRKYLGDASFVLFYDDRYFLNSEKVVVDCWEK